MGARLLPPRIIWATLLFSQAIYVPLMLGGYLQPLKIFQIGHGPRCKLFELANQNSISRRSVVNVRSGGTMSHC